MKPLFFGVSSVALAGWVAVESGLALLAIRQQPIGPDTGVPVTLILQAGALFIAGGILVRLGMLLQEWRRAIDKALQFAEKIDKLEVRLTQAEERITADERDMAEIRRLTNEHAVRLGMPSQGAEEERSG